MPYRFALAPAFLLIVGTSLGLILDAATPAPGVPVAAIFRPGVDQVVALQAVAAAQEDWRLVNLGLAWPVTVTDARRRHHFPRRLPPLDGRVAHHWPAAGWRLFHRATPRHQELRTWIWICKEAFGALSNDLSWLPCGLVPIVIATIAVALHHLLLGLLAPLAVFPDADGVSGTSPQCMPRSCRRGRCPGLVALAISQAAKRSVAAAAAQAELARRESAELAKARRAEAEATHAAQATRLVLADRVETSVGGLASSLSCTADRLESAAQALAAMSKVADGATRQAATDLDAASRDVETIVASAEEMTGSAPEVARQVTHIADAAHRAVEQVHATDTTVARMSDGARRIGDVVQLIAGIAGQTNLLG